MQSLRISGNTYEEHIQAIRSEFPKSLGYDLVTLFLRNYDAAPQQLAKAMKDCFNTFMTNHMIFYDENERVEYAQTEARRILANDNGAQAGKAGFYILELLVSKRWLAAKFFLPIQMEKSEQTPASAFELSSLLARISNRALAPSIGRLVSCVLYNLLHEISKTCNDQRLAISMWLASFQQELVDALKFGGDIVSSNLELYVLPGVFKESKPGFISFVRNFISADEEEPSEEALISLIGALRVGKENGWLDENEIGQLLSVLFGVLYKSKILSPLYLENESFACKLMELRDGVISDYQIYNISRHIASLISFNF